MIVGELMVRPDGESGCSCDAAVGFDGGPRATMNNIDGCGELKLGDD